MYVIDTIDPFQYKDRISTYRDSHDKNIAMLTIVQDLILNNS